MGNDDVKEEQEPKRRVASGRWLFYTIVCGGLVIGLVVSVMGLNEWGPFVPAQVSEGETGMDDLHW